jgi:vitamin K-dependent gamma-carboxylase
MTVTVPSGYERATREPRRTALRRWLFRPVDASGLRAFRVLFGLLMCYSCLRFLHNGWVAKFFVEPRFHFKYWGFAWVTAGPPWAMYALVAGLALAALLVALGIWYRAAIAAFFVGFSYLQLIDVTLYLNHYYLVVMLALLLAFLPATAKTTVPALAVYALRFQVGLVYTCAGLAKLQPDWLLEAQPLSIWLSSLTGLPVIGPLLAHRATAFAASWAGFLFDSTVALFLSWRRSRPFAYAAVIGFHMMTSVLFPIGMFPAIMIVSATVFFEPDWPRRLWARLRRRAAQTPPAASAAATAVPAPLAFRQRAALWALAGFALVQLALPFRSHLYGGNVLWHEQGMRFSWRVMVREKNGSVTYHVRDPASGRRWVVTPGDYLQDYQERDFATQPDLVWQLARRIGEDFDARVRARARNGGDVRPRVEVHAEVWTSLNGRRATLLIDPKADLRQQPDGVRAKPWILPAPTHPPMHFAAVK